VCVVKRDATRSVAANSDDKIRPLTHNGEAQFDQSAWANFQKEEFTVPIYGVPLLAVTATTILRTTNSHQYAKRTMI
jgi:hypothetical protein